MKHQVIFIDWDGTLSGSKFWGHWINDPKRSADISLIQKILFGGPSDTTDSWMLGKLDTETVVGALSTQTGLGYDELMVNLEQSCRQMQFFDSSILDYIADIRAGGVKVVIATDNMDTFTRWTVDALSLNDHFDGILNSSELKAFKKHKTIDGQSKFFSNYLDSIGVPASKALLIDDSPRNQIIESFGMKFALVGRGRSVKNLLSDL